MVSLVIHTNMGLENQRLCATALKNGFKRHGIEAQVTPDVKQAADLHVIQGPWYAYREWLGQPNVIWLDRCFYGCAKTVISLGWLNADGSRDFRDCDKPAKGELPELLPAKPMRRCAVVFGDYGRDPRPDIKDAERRYDSVFYRPHPSETGLCVLRPLRGELSAVFEIGDVAIGHGSTVLVDAEIHGLHVECSDPRHVVHHTGDRETWLRELSWKQWSLDELRAGTFWEHLC